MHDLEGEALLRLRDLQARQARLLSLYGYAPIETPVLEPMELFVRKSGGELAARTYAFTDAGGNQVGLRPEFTASVVRHFVQTWKDHPLPWRVQYTGPVFRFGAGDSPREFTQVGAELLGPPGPEADAEVLHLCIEVLKAAGVQRPWVVLGDVGIYTEALEALGLSERARLFILASVPQLRDGPAGVKAVQERARQLHLLPEGGRSDDLRTAIRGLDRHEARELLRQLLMRSEGGPLGQRTLQEVEERLAFKLQGGDDPSKVQKGIDIAAELATVRGTPRRATTKAKRVLAGRGISARAVSRLEEVLRLAALQGLNRRTLTVDLGLARGIAYYTGIVFEVSDGKGGLSLGGGGRYDTLIRALGHPEDVPALGFALTLESVAQAAAVGTRAVKESDVVLVVPSSKRAFGAALAEAARLRQRGIPAEVEVTGRSVRAAVAYARARGLRTIVTVDASGKTFRRVVGGGG